MKDILSSWKVKLLRKAGKEVLLKAVVSALPTYVMSCYKIPKKLDKELSKLMANFCWGDNENEKKIRWATWKKLTKPKTKGP